MNEQEAPSATWKQAPERGTVFGIRAVVWLSGLFGRSFGAMLLWLIAWYYALFDKAARRASFDYLRRLGHPVRLVDVARHMHTFARVTLDRFLFLCDKTEQFDVFHHGHDLLLSALAADPNGVRRGALLLGSHIGSFEAMRALARKYDVPINIVADLENARRINGLLAALNPNLKTRVIELRPDDVASALDIKACIEKGELVAILGDRATGDERRSIMAEFLGEAAVFPSGPYYLAHTLHCPVFLAYSLFTPPKRYDLYCEAFVKEVVLPRGDRDGAAARYAQKYATRLEEIVRGAPYNWFNFFDFWKK